MRVSEMPRTANSLQQRQQRAGAVADDRDQRGLVVARRRGQRPRRGDQHEPGDRARAVGDVVDQRRQAVALGGDRRADGGVELPGGDRRGGRRGGGDAGSGATPGSARRSHPAVCARACGWLATDRTSDERRCPAGRRATNATSRKTSRVITSGSPSASPSIVAGTEPSTEFSSGTSAASASPDRTAARAAGDTRLGVPGSLRGGNVR